MRNNIGWWWLVAITLAITSAAEAATGGTKIPRDVSIVADPDLAGLWIASGALGSTRYDVPDLPAVAKEIGCRLEPDAEGMVATCWAYTALASGGRHNLQCSSNDPYLVSVVASLNGDSMVQFATFLTENNDWEYPAGMCVSIAVENASKYFPKTP